MVTRIWGRSSPPEEDGSHERSGDPRTGFDSAVNLSKIIRLGWMLDYLEATRQVPLNDDERRRLRDVADQALVEVDGALSQDLRDELSRLAEPLDRQRTPSKDELRVIQAELKGWLLGLTAAAQQVVSNPRTTRDAEH